MKVLKLLRAGLGLGTCFSLTMGVLLSSGPVQAQDAFSGENAESFVPTIWVDPDGCEHWVMDDGFRGYMDIHLTRDGLPVCHRGNTCAVMNSDQLFASGSAKVSTGGRAQLEEFFRKGGAFSYGISGHTDSRASDEYNMNLSIHRAEAVAGIARSVGARVASVRGYGERMPKATNATASGMQANRRVEIECIR
jgi:outer membrane protein OmpA-like peptidoglycan-associated protein